MDDYHRHERQGCDGDAVAEFVNPGMKGDSQVPDTVRKRRNIEIHIFVNLEAPPGFEPGMEVLQPNRIVAVTGKNAISGLILQIVLVQRGARCGRLVPPLLASLLAGARL